MTRMNVLDLDERFEQFVLLLFANSWVVVGGTASTGSHTPVTETAASQSICREIIWVWRDRCLLLRSVSSTPYA